MDMTLANVKSLLKPYVYLIPHKVSDNSHRLSRDGKLLLGEVTHCLMGVTMIFGWLSGWWIGKE
jgi:hypothetical protein